MVLVPEVDWLSLGPWSYALPNERLELELSASLAEESVVPDTVAPAVLESVDTADSETLVLESDVEVETLASGCVSVVVVPETVVSEKVVVAVSRSTTVSGLRSSYTVSRRVQDAHRAIAKTDEAKTPPNIFLVPFLRLLNSVI